MRVQYITGGGDEKVCVIMASRVSVKASLM